LPGKRLRSAGPVWTRGGRAWWGGRSSRTRLRERSSGCQADPGVGALTGPDKTSWQL